MTSTLYADRPEWSDVIPIPQHEPTANPIAPIFYTQEYKDATDYFRGIVKTGEKSQRVLDLTEHIIRLNPAHYSAWQYRFQTLLAINASLEDELSLMDSIAEKYMKTYQVWHHRRLLLQHGALADSPDLELDFISRALAADAKNYHTWSYREWVLVHFNRDDLWDGELAFIDGLLENDVRNNSAWHHRFFVLFASGVHRGYGDQDAVLRRELAYVKQKIALAPNNASVWNYLRGMLEHTDMPFAELTEFVVPFTVDAPPFSREDSVLDLENPKPTPGADLPCPAAIEFLADIYEAEGPKQLTKAIELWKSLASEHDTIRKKYWEYRIIEAKANSPEKGIIKESSECQ